MVAKEKLIYVLGKTIRTDNEEFRKFEEIAIRKHDGNLSFLLRKVLWAWIDKKLQEVAEQDCDGNVSMLIRKILREWLDEQKEIDKKD